jgi:HTH-type transcriptional regulator / antitoxin MqsA
MTRKTKSAVHKKPPSGRPGRVPDDMCPMCGRMMRPVVSPIREPINGESVTVGGIAHLHCDGCGERLFDLESLRKVEQGAMDVYRQRHNLLSGEEIRGIREKLGLTQAQLAAMLRLGANTLSRWEAGRNAQTAAMDILLRLLRDVPTARAYLRRHAA